MSLGGGCHVSTEASHVPSCEKHRCVTAGSTMGKAFGGLVGIGGMSPSQRLLRYALERRHVEGLYRGCRGGCVLEDGASSVADR